jgi:hypothetical protein
MALLAEADRSFLRERTIPSVTNRQDRLCTIAPRGDDDDGCHAICHDRRFDDRVVQERQRQHGLRRRTAAGAGHSTWRLTECRRHSRARFGAAQSVGLVIEVSRGIIREIGSFIRFHAPRPRQRLRTVRRVDGHGLLHGP